VKITVPLVRDVAMMALGSAGTINELFVVEEPRKVGLGVSILLLMGPGFITAAWQAYNAARRPASGALLAGEGGSPPSATRGPDTSPSSVSSSPPSPPS